MKKVFITGSTTGLGFLAGKKLIEDGNEVYLHARNHAKAVKLSKQLPGIKGIAIGDLSKPDEVKKIAEQVNSWGKFDAIIHNAGVYTSDSNLTYRVNVAAPYVLTCLIHRPQRLIYVASGMHIGAQLDIDHIEDSLDYSASKLAVMLLMKRFARAFDNTAVNAVDPGWVPTRMGGSAANDDLEEGYLGQVWLSQSDDSLTQESGNCFYHRQLEKYDQRVDDKKLQDDLCEKLAVLTKIKLK
ncbi:SDR family NAD(P)-dependent oxidoreductase [Lactobacillus sp. LL6]|uniref:SDR family NAD(P)-dependent oxidoreductase n=1 Tax=Lactobacillus sp. LL6 TaxID=2596827 RepID=UPI0011850575|nr:SDR family NAD(P)-dependent oxidoreductase [Lactobacillus sp. LL6]TSO25530.1 SDR family NAD(P)-dependent oxidoreductase [Lactobacillus sp. LL6]